MKILLLHQYFLEINDSGGSRFNEMTQSWAEKGYKITVIAGMMHANGNEKNNEYKGRWFVNKQHGMVKVIRCHVSESYNKGFTGRLWAYFSFVFSSIWAGLFKTKGKFDVILVTSPPLFLGITAIFLSFFKRIPFVFEVRDLWPESAIDTGIVSNKIIIKFAFWFESFVYKKAKLINVLTPAFRKILIEKKKVPSDKIIFIPNAADFSISDKLMNGSFNPAKFRKNNGWENKLVCLYVGAHGVANHLVQILESADLVKNSLPNIHFILIGNGMQKEELKKIAKEKELTNVEFLDPVSKKEVFKYILAADFGCSVLKKVDAFKTIYSNKTFDYMSCKKPVLMAIDGVSRELIEQAACGIYIEPENLDDWQEKLQFISSLNQKVISTLGNNGYLYAKKHFDRSILSNEYIECINSKLIDGR